jgi:hypothetical protein
MTTRETASELRYLRFRCAQIDAAIHALERLQLLQAARCWKARAIPAAAGVGRRFRTAGGRAASGLADSCGAKLTACRSAAQR